MQRGKRVSPGAVKSEHQENTKSLLHQFLRNSSRKKPTGGQAELTGSHAWTGPLYRGHGNQWGAGKGTCTSALTGGGQGPSVAPGTVGHARPSLSQGDLRSPRP